MNIHPWLARLQRRTGTAPVPPPPPPLTVYVPHTEAEARHALRVLKPFLPPLQRRCVLDAMRDEEAQFFYDKMCELAEIVKTMPHTYQQDGMGDDAIVYLHYFAGGQAHWYITEKDKGVPGEENRQQQAFGLADLFSDGGELGYISIEELCSANAELDFHFKPRTLREIRKERDE